MRRRFLVIQFIALTVVVFLVIGISATYFMRSRFSYLERELRGQYLTLIGSIFDEVSGRYGEKSFEAFDKMGEVASLLRFDWYLVDRNLKIIRGANRLPAGLTSEALPHEPRKPEVLRVNAQNDWTVAVRLEKNPSLYLLLDRTPAHGRTGIQLRNLVMILVFVVTIGTVIISLGFLLLYLRSRSIEAQQVLARLQAGELSARFQVRREDEVGGLMLQFNKMAEEIERLVQSLQRNERVKVELLQELGHDLRTPLTTIQNLLETMSDTSKMPEKLRQESLGLTLQELNYIKKLLEDLFFIARMNEPRYAPSTQKIDLKTLLLTEAEALSKSKAAAAIKWDWSKVASNSKAEIFGDSNLLQRMIRNVLNNARRFARNEIKISLETQTGGDLILKVADDGGGFSPEALVNFGNRHKARTLPKISAGEISTGLGSVIVKSVAKLHGAKVEVKNTPLSSGQVGAEVEIRFKKAA